MQPSGAWARAASGVGSAGGERAPLGARLPRAPAPREARSPTPGGTRSSEGCCLRGRPHPTACRPCHPPVPLSLRCSGLPFPPPLGEREQPSKSQDERSIFKFECRGCDSVPHRRWPSVLWALFISALLWFCAPKSASPRTPASGSVEVPPTTHSKHA